MLVEQRSDDDESPEGVPLSLADDPITDHEDDALGREMFVSQTARLIQGVARSTSSTVFGLVAPWGAGKSSLLNLIRTELGSHNWGVIEFNPWEVSDLENLTREFIASISASLPTSEPGKRAREALHKYGRRASSFASFVKIPGVDLRQILDAVVDATEPDTSLESVRKELIDALKQLDTPVLVIIDDVDRLQSDELLVLLKLVRVVGRLPNVCYLLAYDEATLRETLRRSDVGSGPSRAQAYMEKIVQVRVDVPAMHRSHQLAMSNRCIEGTISRHRIELSETDWARFSRIYHMQLIDLLTGPRQIKRYYAQVEAYFPLVADEVDFIDFSVITALRTFFPTLHAALPKHRDALTGAELRLTKAPEDELRERWTNLVAECVDADGRDSALQLLASVFRPVHQVLDKWAPGPGDAAATVKRRGVGADEYFDRYFFLGVPPDDISDAEIRAVISEVVAGGGERSERILEIFRGATTQTPEAQPIIDKLWRFSPEDAAEARALLPFAAEITEHAPPTGFMGHTSRAARWWLTDLLAQASLHEPDELIASVEQAASLATLGWAYLRADHDDDRPPPNEDQRDAFRDALTNRVRALLDEFAKQPIGESTEPASLVRLWAALESAEVVRTWLQAASTTDPWTPADAATFFIKRQSIVGADKWHSGPFDEDEADRLLAGC
jgi:hypothetical protein